MKRLIINFLALFATLGITFAQLNSQEQVFVSQGSSDEERLAQLDIFSVLLAASDQNIMDEKHLYRAEIDAFVDKMKRKQRRYKRETDYMEYVFYKVHNKFLKFYENYITFDEIFNSGNYDCVTGTALYAYIFDRLGYEVNIYESDYHVVLLIQLDNEKVLMEATDFMRGFVKGDEKVNERMAEYRQVSENNTEEYYQMNYKADRLINIKELAGLLYYNLAVKEYNEQNFVEALTFLEKAEYLYPSGRLKELRSLINYYLPPEDALSSNVPY